MSSQFPQVFKSPQLSIYSRSSGSRHARTKIPRYLRDADQTLKAVYNWGRWDGSSADAITAKHDELVKMLRVIHAQLAAGIPLAQEPSQTAPKADQPSTITALAEVFIEHQMNQLERAKGLRVARKKSHRRSNMRLKLKELVLDHGLMGIGEFNARHLEQIRERLMDKGTISGREITIRYGNMILDQIRLVFQHAIRQGWASSLLAAELKTVRMIQNDRRATPPREQRIPTNAELDHFCSLMDEMDPVRGALEFMQQTSTRVAQALRMRWCDIVPADKPGWFRYVPSVEEGCSYAKGKEQWIPPQLWKEMQRFRTRDGKLAPEHFPVFDASTRKGGPVSVKPGTPYKCDSLYNACKRHADRHGLRRISPATLRKRAARTARDTGGMDAAQALLGHRDSRMTSRYLQHVQGEVPEIITKIHREVG